MLMYEKHDEINKLIDDAWKKRWSKQNGNWYTKDKMK